MDLEEEFEDGNGTRNFTQLAPFVNPLLVETVVENIFKYMEPYDLMRWRSLCTLWNDLSIPFLEHRMDEIKIRIQLSGPTDLQAFMETSIHSSLIFRNLCLIEPIFSHTSFKTFFQCPREEITTLALNCSATNPFTAFQFRDLLLNKLPCLRKLELIDLPSQVRNGIIFSMDEAEPVVHLPIKSLTFHVKSAISYNARCLNGLYMATPGLQEFTLKFGPVILREKHDVEFWQWKSLTLFFPFAFRQDTVTCLEFTYLDTITMSELAEKFPRSRIRSLSAKRVHLKDGANLLQFLTTHRESLEIIQLDFHTCGFQIQFPEIMPKLETLCIFTSVEPFPKWDNVDFGVQFPNLKKLKIRFTEVTSPHVVENWVSQLFQNSCTICPFVTELELPQELKDRMILGNIERIFPNVRKLRCGNIRNTNWKLWPCVSDLSTKHEDSNIGPQNSYSSRKLELLFDRYFDENSWNIKGLYSIGVELVASTQERLRSMCYVRKLKEFSS